MFGEQICFTYYALRSRRRSICMLRAIRRFANGSGPTSILTKIGAGKRHVKDPVLTVDDIRNASDWPRAR